MVFIVIVVLIKGFVMILWGMLYFFLVGLFLFIGILFLVIFFLLNIGIFIKNWWMILVGIYFYFYFFGVMVFCEIMYWNNYWFLVGVLFLGLILFYVMLMKLY